MTQIKICGLSEPETLEVALEHGADFIGFMFYGPSPRNVTPKKAGELAARVGGRARTVAVTVDASDALLDDIMSTLNPQFIQAHGSETPERVAEMTRRLGIPVIKSITVREAVDVAKAKNYRGHSDMIMFDAKAPDEDAGGRPGGNGVSFDWSLLKAHDQDNCFILAGGLTVENVEAAIARTGAPIVDVSSGVESAPGVKDSRLIANFIEAAKRAG
jgi:phosphoribosylanthranilate isomerase